MKHLILLFCLVFTPFATAADNAQLVQTNVNVQNKSEAKNNDVNEKLSAVADAESDPSSMAAQQDVLSVRQHEDAQHPNQQPPQPQRANVPLPTAPQSQQPVLNAQNNVQLLKEANAQYQYQINSRYEEKTRPIYDGRPAPFNSQYTSHKYPYARLPGYPYYDENGQFQELGNGRRHTETNVAVNDDRVRSQYENQDQTSYTHQRSQAYLEYGKGESSPEYNTYMYKRMYH